MLQRALFSRGAARTVEASPVEEAYAWGAYVTLAAKTKYPELRLALRKPYFAARVIASGL